MNCINQCTFALTGRSCVYQYYRTCYTCFKEDDQDKGICLNCVGVCHEGHRLGPRRKGFIYCDCGYNFMCTEGIFNEKYATFCSNVNKQSSDSNYKVSNADDSHKTSSGFIGSEYISKRGETSQLKRNSVIENVATHNDSAVLLAVDKIDATTSPVVPTADSNSSNEVIMEAQPATVETTSDKTENIVEATSIIIGDNGIGSIPPKTPKSKKEKDKLTPKRARSAYIIYSVDHRQQLAIEHPEYKNTELVQQLATMWMALSAEEKQPYHRKAAREKREFVKDKNAPKRPKSAYILYTTEHRPQLALDHPEYKNTEFVQQLALQWGALTAEEKLPYHEKAAREKERYKATMKAYTTSANATTPTSSSSSSAQKKSTAARPVNSMDISNLQDDEEEDEMDEAEDDEEEATGLGEAEDEEEGYCEDSHISRASGSSSVDVGNSRSGANKKQKRSESASSSSSSSVRIPIGKDSFDLYKNTDISSPTNVAYNLDANAVTMPGEIVYNINSSIYDIVNSNLVPPPPVPAATAAPNVNGSTASSSSSHAMSKQARSHHSEAVVVVVWSSLGFSISNIERSLHTQLGGMSQSSLKAPDRVISAIYSSNGNISDNAGRSSSSADRSDNGNEEVQEEVYSMAEEHVKREFVEKNPWGFTDEEMEKNPWGFTDEEMGELDVQMTRDGNTGLLTLSLNPQPDCEEFIVGSETLSEYLEYVQAVAVTSREFSITELDPNGLLAQYVDIDSLMKKDDTGDQNHLYPVYALTETMQSREESILSTAAVTTSAGTTTPSKSSNFASTANTTSTAAAMALLSPSDVVTPKPTYKQHTGTADSEDCSSNILKVHGDNSNNDATPIMNNLLSVTATAQVNKRSATDAINSDSTASAYDKNVNSSAVGSNTRSATRSASQTQSQSQSESQSQSQNRDNDNTASASKKRKTSTSTSSNASNISKGRSSKRIIDSSQEDDDFDYTDRSTIADTNKEKKVKSSELVESKIISLYDDDDDEDDEDDDANASKDNTDVMVENAVVQNENDFSQSVSSNIIYKVKPTNATNKSYATKLQSAGKVMKMTTIPTATLGFYSVGDLFEAVEGDEEE